MSPEERALAGVMSLLRQLNIPFMLTGSVATSFHGRPRGTHDAHLVIDPTPPQLDTLVSALEEAGYYVDRLGATRAFRARTQFNVIETRKGFSWDVRKEPPGLKAPAPHLRWIGQRRIPAAPVRSLLNSHF